METGGKEFGENLGGGKALVKEPVGGRGRLVAEDQSAGEREAPETSRGLMIKEGNDIRL